VATILVIDDQPAVRACLRRSLESAGHRVREAADGAAGLEAVRSESPDLILCDLYMPGVDGLDFLCRLRDERRAERVVAMSGRGWEGSLDMLRFAEYLGAVGTLAKPFTPAQALAAVAGLLAGEGGGCRRTTEPTAGAGRSFLNN
jgi:CheY-like chemotaxis protein